MPGKLFGATKLTHDRAEVDWFSQFALPCIA